MTNFPIETQAAFAITAGLCAWLIGALMREGAHKPWEAWAGRIVVGVGVLQLAAFAGRAANQVEFLQFVQRGVRANESTEIAAEYTTPGGVQIRYSQPAGRSATGIGFSSAVQPAGGRGRCGCAHAGPCTGCDGRGCGCALGVSAARPATPDPEAPFGRGRVRLYTDATATTSIDSAHAATGYSDY